MNEGKPYQDLKQRRTIKMLIITSISLTCIFFAYLGGYIPLGLSVKPPIGNIDKIAIERYFEKYPELDTMPKLDDILYEIYGTDKHAASVLEQYQRELENEGYTLKYFGRGYATAKEFVYVGYLKGFTAVGIILTSEGYEDFGYQTILVYMTGFAYDFVPILEWYNAQYDADAFP
jgi:hypothetical protein